MADNKRFVAAYSQDSLFGVTARVIVDQVTGVNYLYVSEGYSGGLSPLLDREGKPVITPVPTCEPK